MNLSDEQKSIIAERLNDGASIADIQSLITNEFDVAATYMETRFLIDDLNLELQDQERVSADLSPPTNSSASSSGGSGGILDQSGAKTKQAAASGGGVTVDIDSIKRPGTALSGSVTFSDGVSAKWYVDPMGRLGLDPDQPNYQPSQEDIETFQMELQAKMQGPAGI